jgi:hypothetical protein
MPIPDDVQPGPPPGPDDVSIGGFGFGWIVNTWDKGEPDMGRLPPQFAGRDITFRIPYTMPGELEVEPNKRGIVFPEATFLHNVDKPFEIHRMIVRLTAQTEDDEGETIIQETQPDTLSKRISMRVTDFSKNENLTKSATLVSSMLAFNTGFWEWAEPYTRVRSEGFQVQIDSGAFPTICALGTNPDGEPCQLIEVPTTKVRIEIGFQGFLVVVAPPSETR